MMIWNAPKWLVIRDGSLLGWWFHENNILAPQMDLAFAAALEMTSVRWNLDMQQHSEKSRLPWCWSEWQKEWMNEWMWWNVMECDGMEWNGMEWMNEWTNNINNINNIKSISSSSRALDERSSLFYFYPPAQQVELAWNKLSWNLPMPRGGNSGKYHQVWTNLNAPCSISIVLHVIGVLWFFTGFTLFTFLRAV